MNDWKAPSLRKQKTQHSAGQSRQKENPSPTAQQVASKAAMLTEDPRLASPDDILNAQQVTGNQSVQRALEPSARSTNSVTQPGELDEELSHQIQRASQSGHPLPAAIASEMKQRLGGNFSQVRIHTGEEADQISRKIDAQAFTVGNNIFFRSGAYHPASEEGRYTLTHELEHVQQQAGQVDLKNQTGPLTLGKTDDAFEQAAHQAAALDATGNLNASPLHQPKTAPSSLPATQGGLVQRQNGLLRRVKSLSNLGQPSQLQEQLQRRLSFRAPNAPLAPLLRPNPPQLDPEPIAPENMAPDQPLQALPPQQQDEAPVVDQMQPLAPPQQPLVQAPAPQQDAPVIDPVQPLAPPQQPLIQAPLPQPDAPVQDQVAPLDQPDQPVIQDAPPQLDIQDQAPDQQPPPLQNDQLAPQNRPAPVNFRNRRVNAGMFKKSDTYSFLASDVVGASLIGTSGFQMSSDTNDNNTITGTMGAVGYGADALGKGIGMGQNIFDLVQARKNRNSRAGKKVSNKNILNNSLSLTTNTLGAASSLAGMSSNIAKVAGNSDVQSGAGYTSGALGLLSSSLGVGFSFRDAYKASGSWGKASRIAKRSRDEDIKKIAKVHAANKKAQTISSGIDTVKNAGGIIGNIGTILGSRFSSGPGATVGAAFGAMGAGVALLGGVGQMIAKSRASKDTDAAAQALIERINHPDPQVNREARRYAQALGIGQDLYDDPNLIELVKQKMGG